MKLLAIRRFSSDYVVFVSHPAHIKRLSKDKRFTVHARYKDSGHFANGVEFRFSYHRTVQEAEKYVRNILGETRGRK